MTVFEFRQRVGADFKEMGIAHIGCQLFLVFCMDIIPIYSLFLEEAVVLIHDLPQSLKVTVRTIGELLFVNAGGEE